MMIAPCHYTYVACLGNGIIVDLKFHNMTPYHCICVACLGIGIIAEDLKLRTMRVNPVIKLVLLV